MPVDLLLINPPLWNAFAPHLAVPLLLAVAKEHGYRARGMDLSAEAMDFLLSPEGLAATYARLLARADSDDARIRGRARRALLLLPHLIDDLPAAKAAVRSLAGLTDPETTARAETTLRNALWTCSAAFDGANVDLVANDLYYSARSTVEVLSATTDPDRNVYRWAFDLMGVGDRIAQLDPAVIGISVSADTQLVAAMTLARMARESGWAGRLVMGGNFVTRIATRWRQRHPFFDLVDSMVLFEGEEAIVTVCANQLGTTTAPVPGEVRAVGDGLARMPTRTVDLSTLPVPDYSDFDLDRYFAPGPVLPTYASRSCAWDCAFCSIPFASNKFRARRADRIVAEMTTLRQRHGARHFYLVDEIATSHSLRELSDELIAQQKDLRWYAETRFSAAWKPALTGKLYESGCRRLSLGLESYNQPVLDRMRKGTKVDVIESNVRAFLQAGIPVHLFCIIGFPGETVAEAQRTIDFATRTCAEARTAYQVNETTWAAAPFVLDLHSPVGQHPHEYGITLVPPPPAEDLALTVDYRVDDGMGQDESWRLMRSVEAVDDGSEPQDPFWFDFPPIRHVEERLFLRACERVPPDPDPPAWLATPAVDAAYRLDAGTVVGRLDTDAHGVQRTAVYSPHRDAILYLPTVDGLADILRSGGRLESLARRIATLAGGDHLDDVRQTVHAMHRLGFFAGWSPDPLTDATLRGCVIRREVGARGHFDHQRGRGMLWSTTVRARMRTGPAGFGLFLLARDGVRVDDPRLGKPPFRPADIADLAREMVRMRLAYGLVDDSDTADPSASDLVAAPAG
jgi:hypothetical protein